MYEYSQVMGVLAGVVSLAAFILYIRSIKTGRTKNPSRVGWGIWALAGGVVFWSYMETGARATLWVPAIFFLGPVVVFVMTWKYSEPGWNWLDVSCIVLAVIGFGVWLTVNNPFHWLLINLGVDFLGLLPILRKGWRGEEDWFSWSVIFSGILLNFFAVDRIEELSQPLYMVVTGWAVIVSIVWPKKKIQDVEFIILSSRTVS